MLALSQMDLNLVCQVVSHTQEGKNQHASSMIVIKLLFVADVIVRQQFIGKNVIFVWGDGGGLEWGWWGGVITSSVRCTRKSF